MLGDRSETFRIPRPMIAIRIGWDQVAAGAGALSRLRYAAYIDDGPRLPLTDVSCGNTPTAAGFSCSARLPPLEPGPHVLDLVSIVSENDAELASSRSRFSFTISEDRPEPSTPPAVSESPVGRVTAPIRFVTRDGAMLTAEGYGGNFDAPVAMAFTPDGRLLVVERGQVHVLDRTGVLARPALKLSDALDDGETGELVDVTLHRDFARNHYAYLLYTAQTVPGPSSYRLARFRELNGVLGEKTVLLDGVAANPRAGGTVRMGPDRRLYLGIEDIAAQSVAQDVGSLNGKILRLNDDGSVPRDNPLSSPVFSWGHGAPAGLAWHPRTGDLWETERRPDGRSALNVISPHTDYGWPDQRLASLAATHVPLDPSMEPAGAAFYTGTLIPRFHHNLFFVSRRERSLSRVRFDATNRRVEAIEPLLEDRLGGIGGVADGPDGALYVFTANHAAAVALPADDRVLRIVPST